MTASSHPCPNCGDSVPLSFAAVRMATCPSCGTTVFLDDGTATDGGSAGDMHDAPLPAQLGDRITIGEHQFDLVGHARYSYGPGWWDEFWALDAKGDGLWISFDEGDVAVQWPAPPDSPLVRRRGLPDVGKKVGDWRVTERETATCLAVRGSFAERIRAGLTHNYVNLEDGSGGIASCEIDDDGSMDWLIGHWVDRWQVKVQ